jgi:hypothetical protein
MMRGTVDEMGRRKGVVEAASRCAVGGLVRRICPSDVCSHCTPGQNDESRDLMGQAEMLEARATQHKREVWWFNS